MDRSCHICLFGDLRVTRGDRPVTRFATQKAAGLLAYLAYHPGRRHPRDQLIALFWPDTDIANARHSLSQALTFLRRDVECAQGPGGVLLMADRHTVCLNPDAVSTDVAEFQIAVQDAARATDASERTRLLTHAIELYRGPFLAGCCDDWVLPERATLAEAYFDALRQLLRLLEQERQFDTAIAYARRGVTLDPLREEAHRDLMRVLAGAGQPEAALRQYRELERLLRQDLETTPSAATRSLACRIRRAAAQHVPLFEPALFGTRPRTATRRRPAALPVRSPADPMPTHNLPTPLTRFFGREREIGCLCEMLGAPTRETRLVTLTGPGGSGKTRLALAVAWRLTRSRVPHPYQAVWFVPLADLSEAGRIADAVRAAMGLPRLPQVEPGEQIVAALRRRSSMLVVDNFEHLVEGGALLVREWLDQVPGLTILATSRRPLNLLGEQEFPVPPLPAAASVALFVDRAQRVRPDFRLTQQNTTAVEALCHRLEGIPLALELAAARVRALTPAQMLGRLQKRFDFLMSAQRDAPPRHRSLRAAIAWSYQLLPPELQRFFAQLCVFRGGWDLVAAEAVCEEPRTLACLEQVRECSLVEVSEQEGEARYRLLETLREYAEEQLTPEERDCLKSRHASYFLALAEEAEPALYGPQQAWWLDRLEREHENIRTALDWSLTGGEAETGLRLAAAVSRFWRVRGYFREGQQWLERALARTEPGARAAGGGRGRVPAQQVAAVRAKALCEQGLLVWLQGHYLASRRPYEESLAIAREIGEKHTTAVALHRLGMVANGLGDLEVARALYEEALAIGRTIADRHAIANAISGLGWLAYDRGDHDRSRSLYREALALLQELGDKTAALGPLMGLTRLALDEDDLAAARLLCEETLAIREEIGERFGIGDSYLSLGRVARREGDYPAAHSFYARGLLILREGACRGLAVCCVEGLVAVAVAMGQFEQAARLIGATEPLWVPDTEPLPLPSNLRSDYEAHLATVRAALGEEAFAAAFAAGQRLAPEEAIDLALAEAHPAAS